MKFRVRGIDEDADKTMFAFGFILALISIGVHFTFDIFWLPLIGVFVGAVFMIASLYSYFRNK